MQSFKDQPPYYLQTIVEGHSALLIYIHSSTFTVHNISYSRPHAAWTRNCEFHYLLLFLTWGHMIKHLWVWIWKEDSAPWIRSLLDAKWFLHLLSACISFKHQTLWQPPHVTVLFSPCSHANIAGQSLSPSVRDTQRLKSKSMHQQAILLNF